MKQYDRYFREFSNPQSGKLYAVLPFAALGLYTTIDVQLHFGPALSTFVITSFPQLYFSVLSMMWFWALWMIASSALFIIWKLFRQYRPGAVLCSDESQHTGNE